jgi:hypothetical protein
MISGRLQTVWRDVEGLNPQDTNIKLATYHSRFTVPFYHNVRLCLLRHLHLDLSQHVLHFVSRFRLRGHILKAETGCWDHKNSFFCGRCACEQTQNEVHVLLMCTDTDV